MRAKSFFNKKDFNNASRIYTELCRETRDAECFYMMSVIYGRSENYPATEQYSTQAIRLNPQYELAWNQLGIAQAAQGKYDAAIASFNKTLELNPKNTQALNNSGNLYRELGNFNAAESCYKKSLELDRKNHITFNNIANIYLTQCRYDRAESYYKKAIKLNKDYFDAYYNLGATYQGQGNHKQAVKYYKRAQKIRPEDIAPQSAMANSYEKQGEYSKAHELITPLLSRNIVTPDIAEIYAKICIKNKDYDNGISVIKKCFSQRLNPINEQALHFDLGDIYDKKLSYDDAFKEYSIANNMRPYQYNRGSTENSFNHIKSAFIQADQEHDIISNNQSKTPVFIVGMPRSGTSLIEQILSSHSEVCGAGELPYIGKISEQSFTENKSLQYPDNIKYLTPKKLDQLSDIYLKKLKRHGDGSNYITDKMPHNFLYIGFIRKLFPECKIIHCLRNPLDVCLSIYFHNFNQNHPYSDNLNNLGHYYNQYRSLMEFWHNQYNDLIVDISYEDLLSSPEQNSKKLIQHIGLEWQDSCLKYYENKRTVNTPSYAQVTQPIYKSSMERWRNYAAHIGDLKTAIDDKYLYPSL